MEKTNFKWKDKNILKVRREGSTGLLKEARIFILTENNIQRIIGTNLRM